jgi:flagellar assembly factor FliW
MDIQSTRFGVISVKDEQLFTFPHGLIGFPDHNRFVLLPAAPTCGEGTYYWLQSADDPELAFALTDPSNFFKDYHVVIREETEQELHLNELSQARLLVICNKVGEWLTGNLLGPIVLNTVTCLAQQVVLTEKKWTCRQPLVKLQGHLPLARAA